MVVTLVDGTLLRMAFCASNSTGYRASKIELDAQDFKTMRRMLLNRPTELHTSLLQMEARLTLTGATGNVS